MKKKLLLISLAVISIAGLAVMKLTPAKQKDDDLKYFLRKAGFNKIPELKSYSVDKNKNYWLDKHGLFFVTDSEMDSLLLINNFIIGESSFYKESIPDEAAKEMKKNYSAVKNDILKYNVEPHDCVIQDHAIWFTENEVGYWMSGENISTNWIKFDIISDNLEDRLSKKGVKVLNDYYNIYSADRWRSSIDNSMGRIFVVADKSKFDTTGMVIANNHLLRPEPPRRDPIAVIKHRGGYVILARWD